MNQRAAYKRKIRKRLKQNRRLRLREAELIERLGYVMAISPDGILGKLKQELTADDEKTVDALEIEIDDFLNLNYSEVATFHICDPISLPVLYEITKRYRDCGWRTYVSPGEDRDYSRPSIAFFKSLDPIANQNIIRHSGQIA